MNINNGSVYGDKPVKAENGSTIVFCLMIILALTMGVIFTLNLSTYEIKTAGSMKKAEDYFRNAEIGLNFAIINFQLIYENDDGNGNYIYYDGDGGIIFDGNVGTGFGDDDMGKESLESILDPSVGFVIFDFAMDPAATSPVPIARVEIRPILKTETTIGDGYLSDKANNTPIMSHVGPAPAKYDKGKYKSRRYSITSTAYNGTALTGISVQAGVAVAALKKNVTHILTY